MLRSSMVLFSTSRGGAVFISLLCAVLIFAGQHYNKSVHAVTLRPSSAPSSSGSEDPDLPLEYEFVEDDDQLQALRRQFPGYVFVEQDVDEGIYILSEMAIFW
ncbi:unnamed protein product [Amoebophrya sp. A120]|nr:unnamed protein product [Amoebophrya sp. A120]|eukprot:GSA120T00013152001.1